jgi:flagellar biosynthesis protein FliQ
MSDIMVIDVGRKALLLLLQLSGPMLVAALIIGLAVSIFQAATHLNEPTMTFIPKLMIVGLVLLFMMPTMAHMFRDFFNNLLSIIPRLIP